MPRGDNPNSRKNLQPFQKGLPEKTQRKTQLLGSKKGNEMKKQYASLTEAARDMIGPKEKEELIAMLHKRAKMGNLKAYELLRDQLGDKPVEKIQVAQIETGTVAEVDNLINGIIGQSTEGD